VAILSGATLLSCGAVVGLILFLRTLGHAPRPVAQDAGKPGDDNPPSHPVAAVAPPNKLLLGGLSIFEPTKQKPGRALDLELAADAPRGPGYAALDTPLPSLPKITDTRPIPLPVSIPQSGKSEQDRYNYIVDRFIEYDIGRLRGREGQKALEDFQRLDADSIPALVRGVNKAANIQSSCPIYVIVGRLRQLLMTTEDPAVLASAVENLGKGVPPGAPYGQMLAPLRQEGERRLNSLQDDLRRRLPNLIAALHNDSPATRRAAAAGLARLGPKAASAIADLIGALQDPDEDVRKYAAGALIQIGPESVPALLEALKDRKSAPLAAAALGEFRPPSEATLRALTELLHSRDGDQRLAAQLALVRFGAASVPVLKKALAEKGVRNDAALALGRIGAPAREVVPDLVAGLGDPDKGYRVAAHHALVLLGRPAVPALADAVKSSDERVWYSAVVALGKIGPDAADAVPTLVESLGSDNQSLRVLVIGALVKIDPGNADLRVHLSEAVPTFVEVLKNGDGSIRTWAALCLGQIGPDARDAVPSLCAALRDPDPFVTARVAESLGRIGPHARDAVPQLIEAYRAGDPEVNAAVTAALVKIGSAAVGPLVDALKSPNEGERRGAAAALGQLGQPAVLGLIPALKDPDADCRWAAAAVLQGMGAKAGTARAALRECLKDPEPAVRLAALQALDTIDPAGLPTLQAGLSALKDGDREVSRAARQSLLEKKPGRNAVPILTDALKDPDAGVRAAVGALLRKVGPDAREALPALLGLLNDGDRGVRLQAAAALGDVAPTAAAVPEALVAVLKDADADVRHAAGEALVKGGRAAAPALAAAVRDGDGGRVPAAEALARIGPPAGVAVPALLAAARGPDRRLRARALAALTEIDAAAPKCLQSFIEGLKDPDEEVRIAAHLGLLKVPAEAAPPLADALKHPDAGLRREVVETLKKIATEGHVPEAIRGITAELVAALRDPDPDVSEGAGWALGQIDPDFKAALPALRRALKAPPGADERSPLTPREDLHWTPADDLIRAAALEKGPRLVEVLRELRQRRGDRVLAALALATGRPDPDMQKEARALLSDYLANRPQEGDGAKLQDKLESAKRRERAGLTDRARQYYRAIVQEAPASAQAEEARRLLKEDSDKK
jgi:HEAT repeat protein